MSTLPERIIEVRKSSGLSQTDFGALGGVGKHTQINYEKGESYPDVRYLKALADEGIDIGYVITGMASPNGPRTFVVEENRPKPYLPAIRVATQISAMTLSDEDADLLISIAGRLANK